MTRCWRQEQTPLQVEKLTGIRVSREANEVPVAASAEQHTTLHLRHLKQQHCAGLLKLWGLGHLLRKWQMPPCRYEFLAVASPWAGQEAVARVLEKP